MLDNSSKLKIQHNNNSSNNNNKRNQILKTICLVTYLSQLLLINLNNNKNRRAIIHLMLLVVNQVNSKTTLVLRQPPIRTIVVDQVPIIPSICLIENHHKIICLYTLFYKTLNLTMKSSNIMHQIVQ